MYKQTFNPQSCDQSVFWELSNKAIFKTGIHDKKKKKIRIIISSLKKMNFVSIHDDLQGRKNHTFIIIKKLIILATIILINKLDCEYN